MPATKLPDVEIYSPVDITQWVFVEEIASSTLVPTRAEIDGGDDLTQHVQTAAGFAVEANVVSVPTYGTPFPRQIPGRLTAQTSSLTCLADVAGADIRTVLPRGTTGFLIRFEAGDVAGQKMDIFPVRVAALTKPIPTDDGAAQVVVTVAITSLPAESVTIPAHAGP